MVKAGGLIGEMIETGLFVLASNPWESGRLKAIAEREGFNIKKRIVIRRAPPWAKAKLHLKGMSLAQLTVIRNFIEKIIEGKQIGEIGPGKPASVYIKRALTGFRSGRAKASRRAKTDKELSALLTKINNMIAEAERARAPVAERVPATEAERVPAREIRAL